MKTLQIITTVIIMNFTLSATSNNNTENENNELSLKIVEIQSPSCYTSQNGFIEVEAVGGEAPYTYDWNTFPNQSTSKAINLSTGLYFVEITDANGDKYFESIQITSPEVISSVQNENEISTVNIEFSIVGGNSPYTYYFNGELLEEPSVENLAIGIHTMVVVDDNNCSMIQYIQVFEIEKDENIEAIYGWSKIGDIFKTENIANIEITPLTPYTKTNNYIGQSEEDNLVMGTNH